MIRILAAIGTYGESAGPRNAQRLRAFILLLRYSRPRIGDAVQLGMNRLQGSKLLLHTEKTGVRVYCVLPELVIQAIDAAPRSSEGHFSGLVNRLLGAPRESGSDACGACFKLPPYQVAMRTDFATPSQLNYSLRE